MDKKEIIQIAIAEDMAIVREGLRRIINSYENFKVTIEAGDGKELLDKLFVAEQLPDLCLLDIGMPVLNGYETIEAIKKIWPSMKVLILTVFIENYVIQSMIKKDANAFLSKNCTHEELYEALLTVYTEGYYYSNLTKAYISPKNTQEIKLSERNRLFLSLCCNTELTYKEMADVMCISKRSVESQSAR